MTDDERRSPIGFGHVRLWLALFVIAAVVETVSRLALDQRLTWPPSLFHPVIFATLWTGLRIAQGRYNAPRP